jgi:hypothetical protein
MKSAFTFLLSLGILCYANISAQNNVGIGTSSPSNKLEVHGNLLVTALATSTNTTPTVAQTKTMINNSTISYASSDSTGRFFDPGGPNGNYIANITFSRCLINPGPADASIQIFI